MDSTDNQQTLADFIRDHSPEHRRGTKALHELVDAVRKTGKAGTITFTVKLEPDKRTAGALLVSSVVGKKIPEFDPPQRQVWYRPSGELVDHDPAQPPIPGISVVFNVDAGNLDEDAVQAQVERQARVLRRAAGVFAQEPAAQDDDGDQLDPVLVAKMADQADKLVRFTDGAAGIFTQEPPADAEESTTVDEPVETVPDESGETYEPTGPALRPGDDLPMVNPDDYDTGTAMALADAVNATDSHADRDPDAEPSNVHQITEKPKRKRRTKAEMEAARAEEAAAAGESQA